MNLLLEVAWLPEGWTKQVWAEIDCASGRFQTLKPLEQVVATRPHVLASDYQELPGVAVPTFVNVHSHAFQRAFAGMTEYKTSDRDSFWTWRQQMYHFLETLGPDQVYQIARQLYREMLDAGYSAVGEFHYLHHDPQGRRYADIAEMSHALIRAAVDVGMQICLLPVLYQRGGFEDSELRGGQRRFPLTETQLFELYDGLHRHWAGQPQVDWGLAFHSLRAVETGVLQRVTDEFKRRFPQRPLHIHIAEQLVEVEQCLATHGARPVELLNETVALDESWCLIHATHLSRREVEIVARSGATVGVCPTTEANLGDGIFRGEEYLLQHAGALAIGSDSHVAIDPFGELRLLEYGQRLKERRRVVLCETGVSNGQLLCQRAWQGGNRALAVDSSRLAVGCPANFLLLKDHSPTHHTSEWEPMPERTLDRAIFLQVAGQPQIQVYHQGRQLLADGQAQG